MGWVGDCSILGKRFRDGVATTPRLAGRTPSPMRVDGMMRGMNVLGHTEDSPHGLGYDPHPDERTWHGTPIPPVLDPLPATPELVDIANRMWWNGDPWTILRNRHEFLRHATDHATDKDCGHLWLTVPRADWVAMLRATRPGAMSMRSYKYWMWRAGLLGDRLALPREWHEPRHIRDLVHCRQRPISALRAHLAQADTRHAP